MRLKPLIKRLKGLFLFCTVVAIFIVVTSFEGVKSEVKVSKYPVKPISIIVPWSPGSSTDLVPRIMAPKLSMKLGVPVNIINKPGSLGVGGTFEAVSSPPDGYTMLGECPSTCSIMEAWIRPLPFKVEERTYLARAVVLPTVFCVRGDSPWKNLRDVEKAIRENPANFGWGFIGTAQMDIGIHQFRADLASRGVDLSQTKTITFMAGMPEVIGLAGGQIDILAGSLGLIHSFLNAGKVKIIATVGAKRSKFFPDIQTAKEQGYPSIDTIFWVGYSGPPGLPENIVQTWINYTKEIVNDPNMLPEWNKLGGIPAFIAGDEYRKFVLDEAEVIKRIKR
jgi:tripartite-type tricarboxylate transporter receptor subunit TctC